MSSSIPPMLNAHGEKRTYPFMNVSKEWINTQGLVEKISMKEIDVAISVLMISFRGVIWKDG